jgi:hypothetical protein
MVAMSRAYEHRFIGVGSEEPRRVLHAGVAMIALVAFSSYAAKAEVSPDRGARHGGAEPARADVPPVVAASSPI